MRETSFGHESWYTAPTNSCLENKVKCVSVFLLLSYVEYASILYVNKDISDVIQDILVRYIQDPRIY